MPARKKNSRSVLAKAPMADGSVKIGEAAKLVGVEPYVLRFWETQFSFIRPRQSPSRHRYYSPSDIQTLTIVKQLLHTQGYTIVGARRFIREKGLDGIKDPLGSAPSSRRTKQPSDDVAVDSRDTITNLASNGIHRALLEIRDDLRALHRLLETD
jgi:DNA-binding transcriptional MerR regulator